MAKEKEVHVFDRNVQHDRVDYKRGQECPKELHEHMLGKGFIKPLEQIKPVEPTPNVSPNQPDKKNQD